MTTEDSAGARERWAEQIMSDERLLGALPEDAAGILLDRTLDRLDQAANGATTGQALDVAAETIRAEARALADQAAAVDDPVAYLRAAYATRDAQPATPVNAPVAEPDMPLQVDADAAGVTSSDNNGAGAAAHAPEPPSAALDPPARMNSSQADQASTVWGRVRGLLGRRRRPW